LPDDKRLSSGNPGRQTPGMAADPRHDPAWVMVKNTHAEACPAFGVVEPTGSVDTEGRWNVTRPTEDSNADVMVAGPSPIPAGGFGYATYSPGVVAAYDDADGTPAGNADWGSAAGSWLLRASRTGFRAKGGSDGATAAFSRPTGGGGGAVVVRADAAGASVSAYVQADDGAGGLDDVGAAITVKTFTAPAREDFELNGYYPAVRVGTQWYAETGPKTTCVETIEPGSLTCTDDGFDYDPQYLRVFAGPTCEPPPEGVGGQDGGQPGPDRYRRWLSGRRPASYVSPGVPVE